MATNLAHKVNRLNSLFSRRLLCRYCSSGNQGDKGYHGNKDNKEVAPSEQSTEISQDDTKTALATDSQETYSVNLEREKQQLVKLRKMYEGTGVEVVKHEMGEGITRRAGVEYDQIRPALDEPKDLDKVLTGEYGLKRSFLHGRPPDNPLLVPRETDVAIIGGGVMGSAVAFWLKQAYPEGLSVTVVERDPTYTQASTVLSVGGLRQQFSLPENIQMSLYTAEFFRNIRDHLSIHDMDPPDIQFNPQGYLFLATESGVETIDKNYTTQCSLGAKVEKMDQARLKERFPWLNVDDLAAGSYGLENEGWFDPWSLLSALRAKATNLGAEYVRGEVVGFRYGNNRIKTGDSDQYIKNLKMVEVKAEDGNLYPMQFERIVNCAGPWAGEIGKLAGIGIDGGGLKVPIPVEPRKRYVYVVHCPDAQDLNLPLTIDPSGAYVRPEGKGGNFLCGRSPDPDQEPPCDDLSVDYEFFHEELWPRLAHRIPVFEKLKLKSAWAGFYDYNYFDQNLIIGNHPYHNNYYMATGCSGHGIQQGPAVGKALMELMMKGEMQTLDLKRLTFDRLITNKPLREDGIV